MDDYARDQWMATHILAHEGEVRGWLRRHVHGLASSDIDDLVQDAYTRLWAVDFRGIANGRSYLFTVVRNLLLEQARRARIVPMERLGARPSNGFDTLASGVCGVKKHGKDLS